MRPILATLALLGLLAAGGRAEAQTSVVLRGRVVDGDADRPLAEASLVLRRLDAPEAELWSRRTFTGPDGGYAFERLIRGRYGLSVERFGYRPVSVEISLERDEALFVSILLDPVPFPLTPIDSRVAAGQGPTITPPPADRSRGWRADTRSEAVRARQTRFLQSDARQLGHDDIREANTLAEDDLLRTLQRTPGVGSRDDYGADLWTRGASAGRTVVRFDGIPVLGALHALGGLSGLNTDMLSTASFQPGVASVPLQGAGAAVLDVTTRSGVGAPGKGMASLSPLSARVSVDGQPSERVGWAVGVRRSYVDALSRIAGGAGIGPGSLPYAFRDVTGRLDAAVGPHTRVEASAFWQDDRVFGDVPNVAYGNEGTWGAFAARGSLVTVLGAAVMRHTVGVSGFAASVATTTSTSDEHTPLHPPTENRYRTLVWESRLDGRVGPEGRWSVGLRASREGHDYSGPGIDLARLLSREELARRGIGDLTPVLVGLQNAGTLSSDAMSRVALWVERRARILDRLEVEGGLRVESGDPAARSAARLAPRLMVRWGEPAGRVAATLAYGRAYQYVQSIASTDVLRSGLRASEIFAQAGDETPALRSDVVTLGSEAWVGSSWLLGATLWARASAGILLPEPTPGVIDGSRPAVPGTERAHGLELSARKLEGRVRGFANYSLSRSRHRVGPRVFDASEDRRHVTNIGVMADATAAWLVGATFRAQSGAPYTRITLVDGECNERLGCSSESTALYGAPGGQRAPTYGSLDLMAEWTREYEGWSLSIYGQIRNALGSVNRITYHSSCVCVGEAESGQAGLSDRFDEGLPRLPLIGLRARF